MRPIHIRRSALGALFAAILFAPAAGASVSSDTNAIVKDYGGNHSITACRFTIAQLQNAYSTLGPDVDTYSPGLRVAIRRELKRWTDGDCKGKAKTADLRIVKVASKGGAGKESVTIENYGAKTVNLRRYVLRDASKHAIRFGKTTLKAGRSLKVVTGCRSGHKSALRKGSTYYGCRKTEFWDDAGDVVQLVNASGTLLSQKQYGTPPAA